MFFSLIYLFFNETEVYSHRKKVKRDTAFGKSLSLWGDVLKRSLQSRLMRRKGILQKDLWVATESGGRILYMTTKRIY